MSNVVSTRILTEGIRRGYGGKIRMDPAAGPPAEVAPPMNPLDGLISPTPCGGKDRNCLFVSSLDRALRPVLLSSSYKTCILSLAKSRRCFRVHPGHPNCIAPGKKAPLPHDYFRRLSPRPAAGGDAVRRDGRGKYPPSCREACVLTNMLDYVATCRRRSICRAACDYENVISSNYGCALRYYRRGLNKLDIRPPAWSPLSAAVRAI